MFALKRKQDATPSLETPGEQPEAGSLPATSGGGAEQQAEGPAAPRATAKGFAAQARAKVSELRAAVAPTLISADFVVRGSLNSSGEIQIDGCLEGDAACNHLVIGETATVTGSVYADTVEMRGTLTGEIRAREIRLAPTCRVEGDLVYETLVIETGAVFGGDCKRITFPRAGSAQGAETQSQPLAISVPFGNWAPDPTPASA